MSKTTQFKLCLFSLICLVLLVKSSLLLFESNDFTEDLNIWCHTIASSGYMHAFSTKFSNYTPLYLYYLVFVAKVFHSEYWIVAIKACSILFDLVLSYYSFKIIAFSTKNTKWAALGACAVFALPTVILNGSMWGQCDSIFTAFIVGSVYYFLVKRNILAFLFFGIAFSLKLQSVFLFPIVLLLTLSDRNIKVWYFVLLPAVFFVTTIPAWVAGGDIKEISLTYFNQSKNYEHLSFNSPSLYSFFPNVYFLFKTPAILFCGVVVVFLLNSFFLLELPKENMTIVSFCFLFAAVVPYFLPAMHERYFFLADIFSLIYCFCRRGKFYFVACFQAISILSYLPFLLQHGPLPFTYLSILLAIVLFNLTRDIFKPHLPKLPIS